MLARIVIVTALVLLVPVVDGEEPECKRSLPKNGANSQSVDCSVLELECSVDCGDSGDTGSMCEEQIPWPPEK